MSTPLGIASVTHVIKNLLNNTLNENNLSTILGTAVSVSSRPPSLIDQHPSPTSPQLNLFLYRVSANTGWNNIGFPSRNSRGDLLNNPPLALDLHYLLTAFGDAELHAEILLGYGMQIIHETPVLERDRIRQVLSGANLPPNLPQLATSELADQIEMIKITPDPINAEEISKLWTAFQTRYRPSTAYKTTVLLIESRKSVRTPLPTQQAILHTFPFKQPVLEKVLSQVTPADPILSNQYILVNHTLILQGHSLKRDPLHVLLGGSALLIDPANISDTQIAVLLPPTLKAGIQGVQITHSIEMGNPPESRRMVESNLLSFVLSPEITNINLAANILTITVSPEIHPQQLVTLILNQTGLPPGMTPASFSFQLPSSFWSSNPNPVSAIPFTLENVQAGDYLVRIKVDGAVSPLQTNNSGTFIGPTITIP